VATTATTLKGHAMTTVQTSRSATSLANNSNNSNNDVNNNNNNTNSSNGLVDYSPSSSISNLKQKFTQSATKNYVNNSNNGNNYLHTSVLVNSNSNNSGGSHGADSGYELSPSSGTSNSLNNSSSTTNVNSIINNFTNLNLNSLKDAVSSHHSSHHGNPNGGSGGLNGGHTHLTASTAALMINSEKYVGGGQETKCLRCGNLVYALERVGPIKGNIYHKTCFKCLICDRQLDLKTYYTNQIDLNERQIYCQSHAPKSGKGVFGADNLYIQNILNGPRLDVMQKVDNKPKVNNFFLK
jgi:hypothetical protein